MAAIAIPPPNKPVMIAALAIGALWFMSRVARAQGTTPGTQGGYGVATTSGAVAHAPLGGLFSSFTNMFGKQFFSTPSPFNEQTGSAIGVPDADARSSVRAGDTYYGAGDAGNNVDPQEAFRSAEYADPQYNYDTIAVNPTAGTADSFTAEDYGMFF